MRSFSRIVAFLLSWAILSPVFPAASGDPAAEFETRVKTSTSVSDASAQWTSKAESLAGEPLFSALGLGTLQYSDDNEFTYDATVTVQGAALKLRGTLKFNPNPASGEPTASMIAQTTAPLASNWVDMGELQATSASLDVVIVGNTIHARLLPAFTNYSSTPAPYLLLSQGESGLDYSLMGGQLTLADFVSDAAVIPFLKDFAYDSMKQTATGLEVGGEIKGKSVSVSINEQDQSYTVMGDDLSLADFVPSATSIPILGSFDFDRFSHTADSVEVEGKIDGKSVTVAKDIGQPSFDVTGDSLQLADFVPQAGDLPFLNNFAFDKLTSSPDGLTIKGEVNQKDLSIEASPADKTFDITGDSLEIEDFIPQAANLSFLNNFSLTELAYDGSGIEISGTVNSKAISVSRKTGSNDFSLEGDDLALSDFIPSVSNIGFLNNFALDKLTHTDTEIQISGKINNAAVAVVANSSDKSFTVTGDDLTLVDFVPNAGQMPFLKNFAFDSLMYSSDGTEVTGKINTKSVTVSVAAGGTTFSVEGDDLKLADFVPEAGQIPFLNTFALDKVARTDTHLDVTGKVNDKAVTVSDSLTDNTFEVTGEALTLADFVPDVSQVPFLSSFAFDSLTHTADKIEIAGEVSGKSLTVEKDLSETSFAVTGDDLTLADFVPMANQIAFLNKFAFDELTHSANETIVEGKIDDKKVSVTKQAGSSDFSVTGADLKLADFIPQVANISFLDTFAFDSLTHTNTEITVDGKIDNKDVSVVRKSGAQSSFTVTGDDLQISDIVPEVSGLKAFDEITLDLVSVTSAAIEVDGKISGKAVTFNRTRGAKPTTTITAASLVLSDLFDPLAGVPGINSVAVDKITLDGVSIEVEAELNGDKVDVVAHATSGRSNSYVAVFFDTLDAAAFIPAAGGHAVNDISLDKALFIVQPSGSPAKSVSAKDLPGDLPNLVGWSGDDTMALSVGVNIAADLNVSKSGTIADALNTVGIPAGSLPLRGTLSTSTFKAMRGKAKAAANSLSAADKSSILAGLNITADLPVPKLPAIAGLVTVTDPVTLSIGGDAQSDDSIWSKLPAALSSSKPADDLDISVQFEVDIEGADIGERLEAVISLNKGTQSSLNLLAIYGGEWKDPFGIDGITFEDGGFKFSLETVKADSGSGGQTQTAKAQDTKSRSASAQSSDKEELEFFATADFGSQSSVAVSADLTRADKKITLQFFELDGSLGLTDLPGGKNIPHADKFQLDTIKISTNGVEAKTEFSSVKVDAFLFDTGADGKPNWTFALDQKDFKISEAVPAAKKVAVLSDLTIPNAALIISEKGLTGNRASMGVIAKDMFDDIFGESDAAITIPSGIGLLAEFDSQAMGLIGDGLNKIGVHEDAIIVGSVTGIFGGTPGVALTLVMEEQGTANGLPQKVMTYKKGVDANFFVNWAGDEIDVGLKIAMDVKAGKDILELSTSIEVEFNEEGLGIKVLGEMDDVWHSPFGIGALSLENLKMDASIDDVGEVKIGFAGEEQFGNCTDLSSPECLDISIASELSISLEDALPDGVAFSASANQISIPAVLDIAEALLGLPGSLSDIQIPFFEIKNAMVAFATPGATDPQLGLVTDGFAFSGSFFFMNKELGSVAGSGGPTSGFTFKGDIDDINLDILEFKENNVDIAINKTPKFIINSSIELLGATQTVKLDIEPPHFEFDLTEDLGQFGEALLVVRLDGFDLMKGTFDKDADISVVGEFKSTLVPWMKNQIDQGLDDLRESATAKLEADKKALAAAQKKVDDINVKIANIRKEDQRAKDRANAKLDSAKKSVSSLKSKYDHDIHEAHHCGSRWTHWACSPGWHVAADATWVAYKVAEGVLDAAKVVVAAAYDLDPRIAGLIAERDIEHVALDIAQAVVTASEDVEEFVLKELKNIVDEALTHLPFEIEEAVIAGDLRDMILHDAPLVFDMKFKILGDEMHEYFAVKIPDKPENIKFDLVSFALLPAIAFDKITEDALKKLSPDAARWVHAHIGTKLAEAEEKVRKEVQDEEAKFKDVLASLENGNAKFKQAFADLGAAQQGIVQQTNVTDLMPDSLEYDNTYLAIGHSSLCLAVSTDGLSVVQYNCKDNAAERWSTSKLDGGYVQLKSKGLCLKARDGDKNDNFQPLILSQCDKDDLHEQWKIVSTDGFFDQIVNRSSQKCLHFNTESANPQSAYAVWTSCLGADSQTFRAIADAERSTWHPVNSLVKAKNGNCLSVVDIPAPGISWFSPAKPIELLYSRKCDGKNERFSYIEEVNGDIRLVHGTTGACIYPHGGNSLAIRACDRGKDMMWRINASSQGGDQFFNPYSKLCMTLPASQGQGGSKEATMGACGTDDDVILEFAK